MVFIKSFFIILDTEYDTEKNSYLSSCAVFGNHLKPYMFSQEYESVQIVWSFDAHFGLASV
jgi:hypothetical protein